MSSYTVIRNRAYWVREVMHVDASTPEEAEDAFFDEFDLAELVIGEVWTSAPFGGDQLYTKVKVIENE